MTKKLKLKPKPRNPRRSRSIRFGSLEEQGIQKLANRYTDGNFSRWVLVASFNYRPTEDFRPCEVAKREK